jgi:hypothetical protein
VLVGATAPAVRIERAIRHFFYEVDDDPGSHEEHLRLAYDPGKTFLATERA